LNSLLIFVTLILAVSLFSSVYAITDTRYITGSVTGTNGVRVVKMLALQGGVTQLALIFSANGSYTSQSATIKASIDNVTFRTVDTVSLSTGTSFGKQYSDANKATTIPVDPVAFPFLNITLPAIAARVQTITWSGVR
jgi:flagellar basal body P-ring protein FlgI